MFNREIMFAADWGHALLQKQGKNSVLLQGWKMWMGFCCHQWSGTKPPLKASLQNNGPSILVALVNLQSWVLSLSVSILVQLNPINFVLISLLLSLYNLVHLGPLWLSDTKAKKPGNKRTQTFGSFANKHHKFIADDEQSCSFSHRDKPIFERLGQPGPRHLPQNTQLWRAALLRGL